MRNREFDVLQRANCTSPKAGSGRGREQLPQFVAKLKSAGIEATVTDQLPQLRDFSARAELDVQGKYLVVAAGGDGTLSLVAENVFAEMPLVPMPFGTENLLASSVRVHIPSGGRVSNDHRGVVVLA